MIFFQLQKKIKKNWAVETQVNLTTLEERAGGRAAVMSGYFDMHITKLTLWQCDFSWFYFPESDVDLVKKQAWRNLRWNHCYSFFLCYAVLQCDQMRGWQLEMARNGKTPESLWKVWWSIGQFMSQSPSCSLILDRMKCNCSQGSDFWLVPL